LRVHDHNVDREGRKSTQPRHNGGDDVIKPEFVVAKDSVGADLEVKFAALQMKSC
jgi:hypothetical protein